MNPASVELLDNTLRDGSYVIDFQFTAEDTAILVSTLSCAGVRLIEIGHGLGLGAAKAGHGEQAASDEEYIRAAVESAESAHVGAFFIPGIGDESDIRRAADEGLHFVRLGTNVNEVERAAPFAKLAKELGLTVFSNLMKSYAVSPDEFCEYVRVAEAFGADYVCLVDSAGGMLPEDVRRYMEAARNACSVKLCFHGHNNLSMAVANTLEAVDCGAAIVDASLQGMGRSEGNAITEIVAAILQKEGNLDHIDVNALLDISEAFVRPLLRNKGYSGLGVTFGRAKFHSSFLGRVIEAAREEGADPRELILRLCQRNMLDAPEDLVREAARAAANAGPRTELRVALPESAADAPAILRERVRDRAGQLKATAKKLNLPSVLNVVVGPYETTHVSPFIQTGFGCAVSNVMLEDRDLLSEVLTAADGVVDYFLLDAGGAWAVNTESLGSAVLAYDDAAMWSRACVNHLTQLLGGALSSKVIGIAGVPALVEPTSAMLAAMGATLVSRDPSDPADNGAFVTNARLDAVVGLSPRKPCVSETMLERLRPSGLVYDGGIGSLSVESIEAAEAAGLRVVRIDLRPALAATALELIHTKRIVTEDMGRDVWGGVNVVAGGWVGNKGDVIVDSITKPQRVIGIADGRGGITDAPLDDEAVRTVRKIIAGKQIGHG